MHSNHHTHHTRLAMRALHYICWCTLMFFFVPDSVVPILFFSLYALLSILSYTKYLHEKHMETNDIIVTLSYQTPRQWANFIQTADRTYRISTHFSACFGKWNLIFCSHFMRFAIVSSMVNDNYNAYASSNSLRSCIMSSNSTKKSPPNGFGHTICFFFFVLTIYNPHLEFSFFILAIIHF